MLFARLFQHLIETGSLTVIDAGGRPHRFEGREAGPHITIRLHDRRLHWRLLVKPELAVGEAFMDGALTVEEGKTLYDFLDLVGRNYQQRGGLHPVARGLRRVDSLFRTIQQFNPASRARRNVAHHYDLSDKLYDLFLDADRQYSCAYYPSGGEDLETAQALKKRHIAAKLRLAPGQSVLDIGSGWGGMGLFLAQVCGVSVDGVTLSEEQLKVSRTRSAQAGLAERVRFDLRDYRTLEKRYDRIVSVGMFEHVGVNHYRTYFGKVRDLLTEDGIALVHSIGSMRPPGGEDPWMRKYIFPGGYIPSLSEIARAVELEGLWITDVEVLRLHYARTLRQWRQRFMAHREEIRALYDDRFCRMWEFYLVASEISFRYLGNAVFQIQLARRQDAVPLTRDYITDADRAFTDAGPADRPTLVAE
ncbi:MAG: cyclopropane-fatty-acyl-phospholipid synthase family protein [Alphaproteobacteria bacterium]|nr:cyclopropane-fatty-acyl-phospholipid synthase family protein [Alphaproteobacteria bacterium]